jgi:hypothetical protein
MTTRLDLARGTVPGPTTLAVSLKAASRPPVRMSLASSFSTSEARTSDWDEP